MNQFKFLFFFCMVFGKLGQKSQGEKLNLFFLKVKSTSNLNYSFKDKHFAEMLKLELVYCTLTCPLRIKLKLTKSKQL